MKIALLGPESCGKSTLAAELAKHFEVPMVDEYARQFLDNLDRPYHSGDLEAIAKGQITLEEKALSGSPGMIICDTNLVVIKVWSLYKYHHCPDVLHALMQSRTYDLQLLLFPDLPWSPDVLRENPHDRDLIFELYEKELRAQQSNYVIIRGFGSDRFNAAVNAIDQLVIC